MRCPIWILDAKGSFYHFSWLTSVPLCSLTDLDLVIDSLFDYYAYYA
jgi:hypothetical protein